jgi:hypothetical protein
MKKSLNSGARTAWPGWQGWFCVVLVGLLLYNPFVGLWGAADQPSCDRLARNRATIGASELQHFSPVSNPDIQTKVDVDVRSTGLLPPVQVTYPVFGLQETVLPHAERFTQLWNRPPPSL